MGADGDLGPWPGTGAVGFAGPMTRTDQQPTKARAPFPNRVVAAILTSRLRGSMARSTVLIRYVGRRSGTTFTTPTQYAWCGNALVIAVARPDTKSWWRNFRTEHPLDVLIDGTWTPMTGRALDAGAEPDEAGPLLDAYLARFPKAEKVLSSSDGPTIVVRCRPC